MEKPFNMFEYPPNINAVHNTDQWENLVRTNPSDLLALAVAYAMEPGFEDEIKVNNPKSDIQHVLKIINQHTWNLDAVLTNNAPVDLVVTAIPLSDFQDVYSIDSKDHVNLHICLNIRHNRCIGNDVTDYRMSIPFIRMCLERGYVSDNMGAIYNKPIITVFQRLVYILNTRASLIQLSAGD